MPSILRGIQGRAFTCAVTLVFAIGCNVSEAIAQLGATKQTVSAEGQLIPYSYEGHDTAPHNWGKLLELEPMRFVSRSTGMVYFLGFKDGGVAYIQVQEFTNNPRTQSMAMSIPNPVLVQAMAAIQYFDEKQHPSPISWKSDAVLNSLFPPCGYVSHDMAEVFSPTNRQSREVTFNNFGDVVKVSDWQTIWRSTGTFKPTTSSEVSYCICGKSRDDKAISIMNIKGAATDLGSSQSVRYSAVMTPEVFWVFAILSTSGTPGFLNGYQNRLISYVPELVRDKVRSRRLAMAIICCTDMSSVPLETVLGHYREQSKIHPLVEVGVKDLLLDSNFLKLGENARKRHYQLAGEIGDVGLISEFMKKMPVDKVAKQEALNAMARIAERHQLRSPPAVSATVPDLRAWAAEVTRKWSN